MLSYCREQKTLRVSAQWDFYPVILNISEALIATASTGRGGRKEVCNHVQLVLLHILAETFTVLMTYLYQLFALLSLLTHAFTSAARDLC